MIIRPKTFPNKKVYEIDYCGRPLRMEVGRLAELANAAVLVQYGETSVLVAVTASPRPRDGIDYFPLSVDFNEKLYAVGRIPGSFMRREGRPSLNAVLASRSPTTCATTSPSSARSSPLTATARRRSPP